MTWKAWFHYLFALRNLKSFESNLQFLSSLTGPQFTTVDIFVFLTVTVSCIAHCPPEDSRSHFSSFRFVTIAHHRLFSFLWFRWSCPEFLRFPQCFQGEWAFHCFPLQACWGQGNLIRQFSYPFLYDLHSQSWSCPWGPVGILLESATTPQHCCWHCFFVDDHQSLH